MKTYVVEKGTNAVVARACDYYASDWVRTDEYLRVYKTKNRLEITETIIDPVSYDNGRRVHIERANEAFHKHMEDFALANYVFPDTIKGTDWVLIVSSKYVKVI